MLIGMVAQNSPLSHCKNHKALKQEYILYFIVSLDIREMNTLKSSRMDSVFQFSWLVEENFFQLPALCILVVSLTRAALN